MPGETREEDYIKPDFHAIEVWLAPAPKSENSGECTWTLQSSGSTVETERASCGDKAILHDVPYRPGESTDGGVVVALDENGKELARESLVVKDTLIVGLGDSYSSGEGNPDRPIAFASAPANIDYALKDDGLPLRKTKNPITLTSDNGDSDFATEAMRQDYYNARALWTSPDCHRSQYSYQFRVALEVAIEDPHRAVTLIHLSCSGADALDGFFQPMDAKELLTGLRTRLPRNSKRFLTCFAKTNRQLTSIFPFPPPLPGEVLKLLLSTLISGPAPNLSGTSMWCYCRSAATMSGFPHSSDTRSWTQ